MKKSTHKVEIVKLDPFKHPNADALLIQKIYGYQVVLRTKDWEGVTYGAYVLPDSVVDTERPEFAWLRGTPFRAAIPGNDRYHRVTAIRLRGVLSYGLMVPVPEDAIEGDDVSDLLGVTRYEPVLISDQQTNPPKGYTKDYDLEAFERYSNEIFKPGERVILKEKLNGVNARYCYRDDRMHVGSKNIWLKESDDSSWWRILKQYPIIQDLCAQQKVTVYGEIIGYPTGLKTLQRYGMEPGEIDFYIFDMLRSTDYLDQEEVVLLADRYQMKVVPTIAIMPFDSVKVAELASGPSLLPKAKHKREGIIVRPLKERFELAGRAVLKLVSLEGYK